MKDIVQWPQIHEEYVRDMIMCEIESNIVLHEMRQIILLAVGRKER